jgi:peptide/nickel transport system substrate-binding protein
MRHPRFLKPGWLVGIPLTAVLVLAVACGDDATPVVIEKEVIVEKEVVIEVPKEVVVIKEVPVVKEVVKEVVMEREVVKEVPVDVIVERQVVKAVEVIVTPTPVPGRFGIMVDSVSGNDATYGAIAFMSSVGDVRGWDPHKHGRGEDIHANGLAYNQLVEYNPLNVSEIIGDLAIDWDVSDDFLHYTFRLNKGVKWQDGEDLDADDIVYSIGRLINEGRSRAGLFRPYMADENPAEKLDTHTVRLNLKQPSGAFMQFLGSAHNVMVPLHTAGAGLDLELYENYMGSGPWVKKSWDEGVSYEWEANPNYFKEGRPGFGGIRGFQITDPGTEIAAYKTERVFMPMDVNLAMGTDDTLRLLDDPDFMAKHDLFILSGASHNNLMMNSQKPPFDQPEARRALYLATDRWAFVEGFGRGYWGVSTAMTFRNPYALPREEIMQLPGYRRNPDGSKPQEDIDEAIRLLNSIGYTDENPMKFELIGSSLSFHFDAVVLAKQMYEDFGLPVEITLTTGAIGAVVGQAQDGDYQMMELGCGVIIFDPDDSFYLCYMPTGRNWSRWTEPGVEELFLKQQVEPDVAKRRELNYEMQRLVYNGSPGYIEHSDVTRLNFVNKRIRTENGTYQMRLSNYTHLKHEHEWLLPSGSPIPGG